MAVVMESDKITIVFIDAGSSDNRPTEITADVLSNNFGIAFIRLCIDIKSVFVIFVAGRLDLFERRAKFCFHFIQKGGAEGITKVRVIKVFHIAPEAVIAVSPFRDETMNVRIPLKVSSKGMKHHDETGSEVL